MERFVALENVRHFEHLLETVEDEAERSRIADLLAEARAKLKAIEASRAADEA